MNIKHVLETFLDLVAPAECPVCRTIMKTPSAIICPRCLNAVTSGKAITEKSPGPICGIWSCRAYAGAIRECIKKFKYCRLPEIAVIFHPLIMEFARHEESLLQKVDIVIPVPICPLRRRIRGYNQSEIIAGRISALEDIPLSASCLLKKRNHKAQAGLSRSEREKNLMGTFHVSSPDLLNGKTVLLVDDVITTGATMNHCAEELVRHGVKMIYGFTLAKTL